MSARLRDSSGFTLLEVLITSIISLALGVGGFAFFRAQARSLTDQAAGLDAIEGARAAVDFMANDIRTAGALPTGSCATCGSGLSAATTTGLTITWDANANGALDTNETIQYSYNAATSSIVRTVGGSAQTLIKNVPAGGLTFQYYNADGSSSAMSGSNVTTPANVAAITVKIQVQAARATTVTTVNLASRVALRNRKAVLKRL